MSSNAQPSSLRHLEEYVLKTNQINFTDGIDEMDQNVLIDPCPQFPDVNCPKYSCNFLTGYQPVEYLPFQAINQYKHFHQPQQTPIDNITPQEEFEEKSETQETNGNGFRSQQIITQWRKNIMAKPQNTITELEWCATTDKGLTNMKVAELNKLVDELPHKDVGTALKRHRRTLKNRGYAKLCREKRNGEHKEANLIIYSFLTELENMIEISNDIEQGRAGHEDVSNHIMIKKKDWSKTIESIKNTSCFKNSITS
ncbi:hypothetical protein SNEBB_009441 [Seison nebaliae]|nr:hypothetical protein SNEBB_009441 [Seison nebaliae]